MDSASQLIWEAYTESWATGATQPQQVSSSTAKPLYHASMTEPDLSCLHSFRDNGINVNQAKGYGQGAGFYLFSDYNQAVKHAADDDSITVGASTCKGGYPMLITVNDLPMTPENFDLDYEVSQFAYQEWFVDNLYSFAHDLAGVKFYNDKNQFQGTFAPDRMKLEPGQKFVGIKMILPTGGLKSIGMRRDSTQTSIRTGQLVGTLMNALQQKRPEIVHQMEAEILPKASAVKYVGSAHLQAGREFTIQIQTSDGKWIDATTQDPQPVQ